MEILKKFIKASLLVQVSLLFLWGCEDQSYSSWEGAAQGTRYHITADLPEGVEAEQVKKKVSQALSQIDMGLSTYREDSEISRFNALPVNEGLMISGHFEQVLAISRDVHRLSGGVFDPTVKPLIDLWGFGKQVSLENFRRIPDAQAIEVARSLMRLDDVVLDGRRILRRTPVMLDFNGIAQGYTVDVLSGELASLGIRNFMVEVGGEVATRGISPRGTPWRIGIESPEPGIGSAKSVFRALELNDAYLSTSGDYRDYYEIDGKRYSHTIDPRSGMPISHRLASVTVIAPSVAHADAWCTALMVLGEEEGFKMASRLNLAAYFIYREGEGFMTKSTPAMQAYLERRK